MTRPSQPALECLVLAQSFETYWAYYTQSSGRIFGEEAKEAARDFLAAFALLSSQDTRFLDSRLLGIGPESRPGDIVERLNDWACGTRTYPYGSPRESRFMLWGLLTGVKHILLSTLELEIAPQMLMSTEEFEHAEDVVRWRAHLPQRALALEPDALIRASSGQEAIVVVADIRRSQDLMTYARSSSDYSDRMLSFVESARQIVDRCGGLFDKFTGDGYLAYFTPTVCEASGLDFREAFLRYVAEQERFATVHFSDWASSVRKLPMEQVGLAIGADLGTVAFEDRGSQLIAVGDAIVWATRMASLARAGEILVNNALFELFRQEPTISFEARAGKTKSGESFLARCLSLHAQ